MRAVSESAVPSPQPAADIERPAPAPPEPARGPDRVPLARYWRALGIPPTDDLQKLDTSFYIVVEKFSSNPTEEEEARRSEMHRAYAVLRRSLAARGPVKSSPAEGGGIATRRARVLVGIAAAVGVAGLLWSNLGTLKMRWVRYEPGIVLRLAHTDTPYGTVVRFDPAHQFQVGAPVRAYELRLADGGRTVWLAERIVEKGMVPAR